MTDRESKAEYADRMHDEGRCGELAPCEHGWPGCSAPRNCPKCIREEGAAAGVAVCVEEARARAKANEAVGRAGAQSGCEEVAIALEQGWLPEPGAALARVVDRVRAEVLAACVEHFDALVREYERGSSNWPAMAQALRQAVLPLRRGDLPDGADALTRALAEAREAGREEERRRSAEHMSTAHSLLGAAEARGRAAQDSRLRELLTRCEPYVSAAFDYESSEPEARKLLNELRAALRGGLAGAHKYGDDSNCKRCGFYGPSDDGGGCPTLSPEQCRALDTEDGALTSTGKGQGE